MDRLPVVEVVLDIVAVGDSIDFAVQAGEAVVVVDNPVGYSSAFHSPVAEEVLAEAEGHRMMGCRADEKCSLADTVPKGCSVRVGTVHALDWAVGMLALYESMILAGAWCLAVDTLAVAAWS